MAIEGKAGSFLGPLSIVLSSVSKGGDQCGEPHVPFADLLPSPSQQLSSERQLTHDWIVIGASHQHPRVMRGSSVR